MLSLLINPQSSLQVLTQLLILLLVFIAALNDVSLSAQQGVAGCIRHG